MLKEKKLNLLYFSFGTSFIIILDQFIKYKIRQIGGFYICNKGISFGIQIMPIFFGLFVGILFIASLFYFYYNLSKNKTIDLLISISLILIFSGAISNFLDRIYLGCVIDFISIPILNFPIFNIADIAISIGGLIIFYNIQRKKTKTVDN